MVAAATWARCAGVRRASRSPARPDANRWRPPTSPHAWLPSTTWQAPAVDGGIGQGEADGQPRRPIQIARVAEVLMQRDRSGAGRRLQQQGVLQQLHRACAQQLAGDRRDALVKVAEQRDVGAARMRSLDHAAGAGRPDQGVKGAVQRDERQCPDDATQDDPAARLEGRTPVTTTGHAHLEHGDIGSAPWPVSASWIERARVPARNGQ